MEHNSGENLRNLKFKIHSVIYESKTFWGKFFDVSLLIAIIFSVLVVMFDSIPSYHQRYGNTLFVFEWIFTILFTIEYLLRLFCIRKPLAYAVSPMGIIDLLAILPSYLSFFFVGSQYLMVVRSLRLLRIFRIFKLMHFMAEGRFLLTAIYGSLRKISIFILFIIILVIIVGSLMYLIESGQNGFNSIPDSIYWAVVTVTTVGYGDISPVTPFGKFIAILLMLCGYGIIAVPTGIVTTEMALIARKKETNHEVCPSCGKEGHDKDALFCKQCGSKL